MNILVIDDKDINRERFCSSLRETVSGINCIPVRDEHEAVVLLRKGPVDISLIFIEINMCETTAMECLLRIKSVKSYEAIPVVMYSSLDDGDRLQKYRKLGAIDFLPKSILMGLSGKSVSSLIRKAS